MRKVLLGCVAVAVVVGMIAILAVPEFRASDEQPRDKACAANIRVLKTAIEMYIIDTATPTCDSLADFGDPCSPSSILLTGQYLKTQLSRPELACEYVGTGLLKGGEIRCLNHGSLAEIEAVVSARERNPVFIIKRWLRSISRRMIGFR